MSIEEAINELKHAYAFCKTEPSFQEAINIIIHDFVKYEWHDLRKNPDDLPKLFDEVLVCAVDSYGNKEYVISCKVEQEPKEDSIVINGWSCLGKVIAWREIEPFEEVE